MKIFFSTFVLVMLSAFYSANAWASASVIINKKNVNKVSSARIKQLFTLRKSKFKDGHQATLYLPKKGLGRELFLKKVLFYSESRLNKRYNKMVKAKKGIPPTALTDEQILAAVASEEYAIGVIDSQLVNEDVTVIYTVD